MTVSQMILATVGTGIVLFEFAVVYGAWSAHWALGVAVAGIAMIIDGMISVGIVSDCKDFIPILKGEEEFWG